MKLLVTGAAGYIGSHMVRKLLSRGIDVVALDSLEYGHREALPSSVSLVIGSVGDEKVLTETFSKHTFDGVMHFAGYIFVEESVQKPLKYFNNNFINGAELVNAMIRHDVNNFIFSSTAAIYGNPVVVPIPEDHKKEPSSPYGLSKWCFEEYLGYVDRQHGVRSISLRYFNAAGAALDGTHGEAHNPESHIIPLAMATAGGKRREFHLFGTDYETPDGTCLRDYIHIEDLCEAHLLAMEALINGHKTDAYNVGMGKGTSNREMVSTIKKVTGVNFPVIKREKRAGDPAILVADSIRLQKELGWKPKHSDVRTIVESAWKWHKGHPQGYAYRH